MKLYRKGTAICEYQIDDTWEEIEDEFVDTPCGKQLKSFTLTPEFAKILQKQEITNQISTLKAQINKYKEDVEQVELFGMERADYEEKKAQCVQIIEELRILERQLKGE